MIEKAEGEAVDGGRPQSDSLEDTIATNTTRKYDQEEIPLVSLTHPTLTTETRENN